MRSNSIGFSIRQSLLSAAIGAALCAPFASHAGNVPAGTRYVTVPKGVYRSSAEGARLIRDYGAFQLYALDGNHFSQLQRAAGNSIQVQDGVIGFNAGAFDPLNPVLNAPATLRAPKYPGVALRLVQFVGPVTQDWLQAVRNTGATPVQYIANNAYYVLANQAAADQLDKLQNQSEFVRFAGPLEPIHKFDQTLASKVRAGLSSAEISVTVVLASHGQSQASKSQIQSMARGQRLREWGDLRGMESISIKVSESDLTALALLPDVIGIEQYVEPRKFDEVQSQIMAGNLNGARTGPSGVGYLPQLTTWGFSTDEANYPIVQVTDDGVGTGVTAGGAGDQTLTRLGLNAVSRIANVTNCTTDTLADGSGGHGHINANIVGGFDARTGAPSIDPNGFMRGTGINPYSRLGNTKIFTNAGSFNISNCANTITGLIKANQDSGSVVSSNSWGAAVGGAYNADARAYDVGTRDADAGEGGNQQLTFVFAAGNSGSGANTVGSPGTAKNVITVGASENFRPNDEAGNWTDGCGVGPTGADNAMDVIGFSSRGPTDDARVKPEVIGPGTHIQGTATTAAGAVRDSTCDSFRPPAQTIYAASSGTSHSTPAIAGTLSLQHRFLNTAYGISNPSPALMKAYLLAHPTYLTGVSANDSLPSNSQGYGMPNMGLMFDAALPRVVVEQGTPFTATGQSTNLTLTPADSTKPVRVVLTWSDAAGPTTGNSFINNLDLTANDGTNSYRGNRFTGATSTPNPVAAADAANNYEAIFLPAGFTSPLTVTVTAANIAGDGVTPGGATLQQDYALVCSNCVQEPTFTLNATPPEIQMCVGANANYTVNVNSVMGFNTPVNLSATNVPAGATSSFGTNPVTPTGTSTFTIGTSGITASGDYTINLSGTAGATTRNTAVDLGVDLAAAPAAGLLLPVNGLIDVSLTPTFSWNAAATAREYIVEVDDDPGFGSIDYTATTTSTTHTVATPLTQNTAYNWRVRAVNYCGSTTSLVRTFTTATITCNTFNTGTAVAIADVTTSNATIAISGVTGSITDLDVVGLRGTHTFTGDLDFFLRTAAGAPSDRELFTDICSTSDNFHVTLDDSATALIGATCPMGVPANPALVVRPEVPLSGFNGTGAADINGTWTLRIVDDASGDTGNLQAGWGLKICTAGGSAGVDAVADSGNATEDTILNVPAPGLLSNDANASGALAFLGTGSANGSVVVNTDGSYVFDPAPNFCGNTTFTYQLTNGSSTDTATATIAVACVNDAPVSSNDAYTVNEDATLSVPAATGLLTNDTDIDSAALTTALQNNGAYGTATVNANGSFTFDSNDNYCGTDTFTYLTNDGALNSNPAGSVNVTVVCINDNPVAVADSYNGNYGAALNVAAPGVLVNDSDIENEAMSPVFPSTPANGSVTLGTNGSFVYTPNTGFCGVDTFTYRLTDGIGFSNTATVTVTIACPDQMFRDGFE